MKVVVLIISEGKHYFSLSSSSDFSVAMINTGLRHAREERVTVAYTSTEL